MKIKIGQIYLGHNLPCFVVAEMSGNHNGKISRALKIIHSAKKAGANAVKLQTYTPDSITLKSNRKDFVISRDSPWFKKKNLWNLYKFAHTPIEWHKRLFQEAKKIKIEVGQLPNNLSLASSSQGNKSSDLGIVVRELTFEEKREMKLTHGVRVTEVNPEGSAAQQGVQKGDIITYLGNNKIRNNRDLSSALEKAKESSDAVMIGIVRNGIQTFRSLKLTK